MDKTFLGILDNHVQEINKSVDSKSANDILLKTVKLLLDKVDYSNSVLAKYSDKMEMRKFFSSFGRAAQATCDFYQASKEHLDPEALNGEIGRKLEKNIEEITKVNMAIKSIEENEAILLNKEKELNEKNDNYENLKKKISTLKEFEQRVTIESLNELKREAEELDLHLGENSKIAVKLKEYGISKVGDFPTEIDNLRNHIKSELTRFDNIIKGVIKKLEEEKEDIGRRNKTLT